MTRIATTARHVVPAESPRLTFKERYAVVSEQFPGWLVDEPIRFPRLHPTFGWACRVNGCNAVVHDADPRLLCVGHAELYSRRTDDAGLNEFAVAAEPFKALTFGWGLVRRAGCRICGDNREAQQHQYCMVHANKLRRARRSPIDESVWASAQSAGDPFPPCALPGCVHDGELSAAVGADRHLLCRGHRQSWRSHGRTLTGAPTPDDWSRWTVKRSVLESVTSPDARGHLTTAHLPLSLRHVIRYALHRYANTASRTQWRPAALQVVVDALAEYDVQSFDDPVVVMLTERSGRWSAERRVWLDLVPVVRAATVTPEAARAAGWFDPAIVGAGPFPGSQGQENRRKEWNLTAVTQRWLRDLLWDYLHDEALQPVGRKGSSCTIFNRIVGIVLLSRILRHIRADRGEDPGQLTNADARAVKDMWDLWFREQIPIPRRADASEGDWAPLNHRNRHVYMANMRIVLRSGREHRRTPPSMDSFILGLPQYPRPHESPRPRPLTYADFQRLVSAESVATLSDMDDDDVGLADIWLTQAFQGGRISETLKLRLGCVGLIGAAQPYIWRDISKVDLIDYGMPCYLPVYERLLRRQDKTRRKLRARYADTLAKLDVRERSQLEARWERSMPLFPRSYANPDLLVEVTQSGFRRTWTEWFETLGLQGLTTHQTRATLATSLLNNGAPAELVRQLLGHFSSESLAHYANYSNDTMTKHLQKVWAAGPGMDKPGTILLRPTDVGNAGPAAAAARIDLTIVPVEHGLCRYGPVVGGGNCPFGKNCSRGQHGACEHFVLTGADLAYWERKRDAAYHFAEGAPTDEARNYILGEWQPWETVLGSLSAELDELGLLEQAQNLDLRAPVHDYFEPIFATGWPVSHLYRTDDDNEAQDDTSSD